MADGANEEVEGLLRELHRFSLEESRASRGERNEVREREQGRGLCAFHRVLCVKLLALYPGLSWRDGYSDGAGWSCDCR
jgi:hypothetical protein